MDIDSKLYKLDRGQSTGYLTNWAARLYARAIDIALSGTDVSSGMLPVFFALSGGEPRTQKEVAQAASVEQPTMAATLSRMERAGLIERTGHPTDRRSSLIRLSTKGRKQLLDVQRAVREVNEASLAGLAPADQARFREMLKRVIGNLDALC